MAGGSLAIAPAGQAGPSDHPMTMNERYDPQSIEPRWQERWERAGALPGRTPGPGPEEALRARDAPVPLGRDAHGTRPRLPIGDVLARYLRMRGFDVLHPIGFDALGLPAENAAIKDGVHPAERTRENIVRFRAAMKLARLSPTTGPARSTPAIPSTTGGTSGSSSGCSSGTSCTGGGQGQLVHRLPHGHRERAGEGRALRALRVAGGGRPDPGVGVPHHRQRRGPARRRSTSSREWPERITTMQRNWIGKSEGAEVDFAADGLADRRLHHPRRHHLRLHLRGARPRPPARRQA